MPNVQLRPEKSQAPWERSRISTQLVLHTINAQAQLKAAEAERVKTIGNEDERS